MVGKHSISNYNDYVSGMEKSIEDKLFFLNKLDFDVIVDYGCSNGKLLKIIKDKQPDISVIGYDLDSSMLDQASNNVDGLFTNKWGEVIRHIRQSGFESPLLNLGSVIHELYSYGSSQFINFFWNRQVFSGNFKYITIRDMIPSLITKKVNYLDDVKIVKSKSDPKLIKSFEKNGDHWKKIIMCSFTFY